MPTATFQIKWAPLGSLLYSYSYTGFVSLNCKNLFHSDEEISFAKANIGSLPIHVRASMKELEKAFQEGTLISTSMHQISDNDKISV